MVIRIVILNSISNIKICDIDNNVIFDNICDGYIFFNGKMNNVYKIIITSVYGCIVSSFIIDNDMDTIIYSFDQNSHRIVIFKLYDSNYENLLIEKGGIKLWLSHM